MALAVLTGILDTTDTTTLDYRSMSNSSDSLVTVSLRMPRRLHDKLVKVQARQAESNGKMASRNALIVAMLDEGLERATAKKRSRR